MANYRLTSRAATGLRNILVSVSDAFGANVAERVLDRMEDAFAMIAANPNIGHHRHDLTLDDHIRFWSVGPTLLAYRSADDGIEVLLIERGGRDWSRLLAQRSGESLTDDDLCREGRPALVAT